MASAFHHIFKFDNSSLGGGSDDDIGICPVIPSTDKNYSKTFIIPSQAKDFAFCAICEVCNCKMTIEMSPDGVNWCPCLDADQKVCENIVCEFDTGACTCKIVNAPMMQYVRVSLHDGVSSGGKCKVSIHWTTF